MVSPAAGTIVLRWGIVEHLSRIAKNSAFQAAALAAQGLTEFLIAVLLARVAGPELLGEFTTLVILAGLFEFISDFGMPSLLTREIARVRDDPAQITRLINAAVGLVLLLSLLALLCMTVLGILSDYSPVLLRALVITALALAFESLTSIVATAFRGIEALDRSSAVTAVMQLSFLTLGTVAVVLHAPIDGLMLTYVVSRIIALTFVAFLYRARFGPLRPAADHPCWQMLLKKAVPFSVNSIFSFAYSRADVIFLSYLTGNVSVGFYEAAYTVTLRLNLVARALTFALYPFLSSRFVHDVRSMRAYTAMGVRWLIIPGVLIATLLWSFGDEFLRLLYGPVYAVAAVTALGVLALAVPIRFVETLLAVSLDASNRAGQRATAVAISGTINALLNLILIPPLQMMGAVYSTVITEVVITCLFLWYLRHEFREIIDARVLIAPALGAALILATTLIVGRVNVWLMIGLSVVVYGLVVVVLDRTSLEPLRALAGRRQA